MQNAKAKYIFTQSEWDETVSKACDSYGAIKVMHFFLVEKKTGCH